MKAWKKISVWNIKTSIERHLQLEILSTDSSVTQLCLTLCDPTDCSMPGSLSITTSRSLLKLMSIELVMPSNLLILCHPLIMPSIFSSSRTNPVSQFFTSGGQRVGVSASGSVLPMNIQNWFPLGLTGWSPYSPRDSQETSPTSQFKTINSSGLSFLYSPTLISIHDYWKNHSID